MNIQIQFIVQISSEIYLSHSFSPLKDVQGFVTSSAFFVDIVFFILYICFFQHNRVEKENLLSSSEHGMLPMRKKNMITSVYQTLCKIWFYWCGTVVLYSTVS